MSKSAIVTGATKGIGRATAERLATLGFDLLLLGRNEDALSATAGVCRDRGSSAQTLVGDLSEEAYMDAAVAAAFSQCGSIDLLVNNAGMAASM